MSIRNDFVSAAKGYIGANEADGSFKPIIDLYNTITPLPVSYKMSYTDPWCAAFVSAVAKKCGITEIVLPECSVDRMIALYKAAGRWIEADDYVPLIGDLVTYDWDDNGIGDNTGSADHIGIVETVSASSFVVIEGNMSDKVGRRTIEVNGKYIRGFCSPDFENAGKVTTTSSTQTSETVSVQTSAAESTTKDTLKEKIKSSKKAVLSLPYLQTGDAGESVRAAQILLIGLGYSCGPYGADGEFGAGTAGGVLRFQRGRNLEADSIIGPDTWSALLGL